MGVALQKLGWEEDSNFPCETDMKLAKQLLLGWGELTWISSLNRMRQ